MADSNIIKAMAIHARVIKAQTQVISILNDPAKNASQKYAAVHCEQGKIRRMCIELDNLTREQDK